MIEGLDAGTAGIIRPLPSFGFGFWDLGLGIWVLRSWIWCLVFSGRGLGIWG